LRKNNQQQSRLARGILFTPHIPLRLVKLSEQLLDTGSMQEAMCWGGKVKVALNQPLAIVLGRQNEESGVKVRQRGVAKGEDGGVVGPGIVFVQLLLDAEEE
jgi:hypothetical protein